MELNWERIHRTLRNGLDVVAGRISIYHADDLTEPEIEFVSLYFKDTLCLRVIETSNGVFNVTLLSLKYRDLETIIIPRVEVTELYRKFINEHRETNRIKSIFMELYWNEPPWIFSIDKDSEELKLVEELREKGYRVDILEEDETSLDLKVEFKNI